MILCLTTALALASLFLVGSRRERRVCLIVSCSIIAATTFVVWINSNVLFLFSADTWNDVAWINRFGHWGLDADPHNPVFGPGSMYLNLLGVIASLGVDPLVMWRDSLILCTPMMLICYYLLSARIVGAPRIATLATFFTALGFGVTWLGGIRPFGTQFSNYPWSVCVSILLLAQLMLMRDPRSNRQLLMMSIVFALVPMIHIAGMPLLFASVVMYALLRGKESKYILIAFLLSVLIASPWLLFVARHGAPWILTPEVWKVEFDYASCCAFSKIPDLSFLIQAEYPMLILSTIGAAYYVRMLPRQILTVPQKYALLSFLVWTSVAYVEPLQRLISLGIGCQILVRSSFLMFLPLFASVAFSGITQTIAVPLSRRVPFMHGHSQRESVRRCLILALLLVLVSFQIAPKLHFYSFFKENPLDYVKNIENDLKAIGRIVGRDSVVSDRVTSLLLSYFSDARVPVALLMLYPTYLEDVKTIMNESSDLAQSAALIRQLGARYVLINHSPEVIGSWGIAPDFYCGHAENKFSSDPQHFVLLYAHNDFYLFEARCN